MYHFLASIADVQQLGSRCIPGAELLDDIFDQLAVSPGGQENFLFSVDGQWNLVHFPLFGISIPKHLTKARVSPSI